MINATTIRLLVVFVLLFTCGCGTVLKPGLPADAFQAEADAVVAMAFAASPVQSVEPDDDDSTPDRKVGDKCDNCNGTGRSGDGLGKCRVCNGDGRIDRGDIRAREIGSRLPIEQPDSTLTAPETSPVTIVLHVSQGPSIEFAKSWWINEKPYFESLGFIVQYEKHVDSKEVWIEVCGSSTCQRIDGEPTRQQLMKIAETTK